MKRSEMFSIIAMELSPYFDTTSGLKNKAANEVLKAIEESGMIPPIVHLDGSTMTTKELLDYSEIDYTLGWEDEDDSL